MVRCDIKELGILVKGPSGSGLACLDYISLLWAIT